MSTSPLLAVLCGKIIHKTVRLAGSGGGSLPGLLSQKLRPSILHDLSKQCSEGVILICGTNGKTTTSRLLASLVEQNGRQVVHNRSGSNMSRGHIAAFLEKSSWKGKIQADLAILEVDEAVLAYTIQMTKPRLVLLHNLFRDQLDRYGEVNSIAQKWQTALREELPPESLLVVNADDPNLVHLAQASGHPHIQYYGLDDPLIGSLEPTSAVDAYLSPTSATPLHYSRYFLSHLGIYRDSTDGFKRPNLDFSAQQIKLSESDSSFTLHASEPKLAITLPLPGLYNVYNALAASSTALQLGLKPALIAQTLSQFKSAFGRFERVKIGERELVFYLIKNPVGASEVLRTLSLSPIPINLAIFANDNFADGQDVSWYWDTAFELMAPHCKTLTCAGSRAQDMALRLTYAGAPDHPVIINQPARAFDHLLAETTGPIAILSTYTATLELQKLLTARHIKSAYWNE